MTEPSKPINRWLITGTLTTLNELRIGDGGAGELDDRAKLANKGNEQNEHDASTVMVDARGKATIPGSSLKGPIRALVKERGLWGGNPDVWKNVLGDDVDGDDLGGKVRFMDALWADGCPDEKVANPQSVADLNKDRARPWWDHTRRTCVQVGHARDAETNAVDDQKLYHREYVPPGETFTLRLLAENLTDVEAGALVGLVLALKEAGDKPPVAFGAVASKHWGRMQWDNISVKCVGDAEIKKWLAAQDGVAGSEIIEHYGVKRTGDFRALTLPQADELIIELNLVLDSPWLVGDPKQGKRCGFYKDKTKKKEWKPETHGDKPPDEIGAIDKDGKPFDPATSLAGALRAQAGCIVRMYDKKVCSPEPALKGKDEIECAKDLESRDPVSQLFGFTGWKSPLECTRADIVDQNLPKARREERIAIDRLFSDSSDGAKFDLEPTASSRLKATLVVNMTRLGLTGRADVCVALLMFMLRDLLEGDVFLGADSGIGLGWVGKTSSLTVRRGDQNAETFAAWASWPESSRVLTAWDTFINEGQSNE
ncbi:MAG TPA: RAMP superfamily CRISPR-associated protein [Kiritimatiellia bacterium]|nr:RAMP superfamily CRISPR-associated protein [Kiritimatiellia bacterium]